MNIEIIRAAAERYTREARYSTSIEKRNRALVWQRALATAEDKLSRQEDLFVRQQAVNEAMYVSN